MVSLADPFVAHCLDMLRPLGIVRGRRMFSGCGVYVDDVFVAVVIRDELYLKADDATRDAFTAAGGRPFVFKQGETRGRHGFWTVPPEAMESPALMLPWARLALAAGLRARAAKPGPPDAFVVAKKAGRKANAAAAAGTGATTAAAPAKPAAAVSPRRSRAR